MINLMYEPVCFSTKIVCPLSIAYDMINCNCVGNTLCRTKLFLTRWITFALRYLVLILYHCQWVDDAETSSWNERHVSNIQALSY
jgi:hypothetical protein